MEYWILSLIVGVVILFFFPEPETNFIFYLGTAILFIIITIILYKKFNANKNNEK
jgi:L-asparagine transporter-like permease